MFSFGATLLRSHWPPARFRAPRPPRPRSARRVAGAALIGAAALTVAAPVACAPAKLPAHGVPGTKYERTFIAVKPDGVQRGLVGNIIARFEAKGYKLVALKMVWPTKEMASNHYGESKLSAWFCELRGRVDG